MPDFAVLRIAKFTSLKGLAGAAAHNSRTANSGLDHADSHSPLMGGGVQLLMGQDDAIAAWHARTSSVGLTKPRKGAVQALEVVMSASPTWFAAATPEDRQAWLERSISWAKDTFAADNILSAHLHDDEETPHAHFFLVPLKLKQRKKAGRPRKGREKSSAAATPSWGLAAADWIGSPEKLTALQTSYASQVADLGIRRGIPRRVTGARHRSASVYRAEAAEQSQAAQVDRLSAAKELSKAKATRISAVETAIAFSTGLDAVDVGELVYRPADSDKSEGLQRKAIAAPVLPPDRLSFEKWKRAIQPMFKRLIGYARRLSLVAQREQELTALSDDLATEAGAIRRVAERQAAAERASGAISGPSMEDAEILVRSLSRETRKSRTL